MGRKTKYDPETFPKLAEGFAREGLNDEQISSNLGISKDRFYYFQKKYPDFFDAVKRGKAPVDMAVENALLKRALGYEFEETSTEVSISGGEAVPNSIKKTKKHIPPDVGAAAFWLKNRRPDRWKETRFVDARVQVDNEKNRVAALFPTEEELNESGC